MTVMCMSGRRSGKTYVLEKAKRLVEENKIKVEEITDKSIYFKVEGDTDTYSVIFNKKNNTWRCDCMFSSLKKIECSHRLACKLLADKIAYDGDAPLWRPDLKFTPMSKAVPTKLLLIKALVKLGLKGYDVPNDRKLRDDYGIFGYNLKSFVLVAKQYIMGWVVSAHKRAVVSALNQSNPLVMFLDEQDKFYEFDPKQILEDNVGENYKGTALMVNWDIRLGKRIGVEELNERNKI